MNSENQELDPKNEQKSEDEISARDMGVILQILSLEKQNNKSSKKLSQQEIVNKILNIIRREVENEIH